MTARPNILRRDRTITVTAVNDAPVVHRRRDAELTPRTQRGHRRSTRPDGHRRRQHQPGERHGVDHRQLRQRPGRPGFTNQNGITGSFNAATGVLTLTGSATRGQLPDGAALGDLRQHQRQPVGARRAPSPRQVNDGAANSTAATAPSPSPRSTMRRS